MRGALPYPRHPCGVRLRVLYVGRDLIGIAATGSGKTLAFVRAMLHASRWHHMR